MTRNKPEREEEDWDDGHVIVNMDVEGMPWNNGPKGPKLPDFFGKPPRGEQMSARQVRQYTFGALKAGLLMVLVYCACLVLFVLFCLFIWFR